MNEKDDAFVAAVRNVVATGVDPATGKPAMVLPRGALDRKPPHGAPCNRCGLCCLATLCPLGRAVFKVQLGPCPALRHSENGEASCGLAVEPEAFVPRRALVTGKGELRNAALVMIGSGDGCDARFNGEPVNHPYNAMLDARDREPRRAKLVRRAKRVWGMK